MATLPDLCTTSDVAAFLQRDLTPNELTFAGRLITMASATIRKYVRQEITETVDDVVTLPGNWSNNLVLPQRPVSSVSNVVINSATAPNTQWKLIGDELYLGTGAFQPDMGVMPWGGTMLWGPAGSTAGPQATGATWQGPQSRITVTYTHGHSEVPQDITNVCAGLVAMAIQSPVGVTMESVGGYKVQYGRTPTGAMSLTDDDKAALAVYRKRAISSDVATRR